MKKILLIFSILLLCSCEAKYKIVLDENTIHDEIKITEKSTIVNNATDSKINEFTDVIIDWERGYEYYKRELITENDLTGYLYTDDFKYDEYDTLSQISKCYSKFEIKNDNKISINTSEEFLCADYYEGVKDIEIIIESKFKVIKTNADKQDGNKQIWYINKNNYEQKPILLELDKNNPISENNTEKKINTKFIIVLVIFVLLIIINFTVLKKDKNKK